jgi:serine/threonine-protein kinase
MTPERQSRVEELFEQLADQPQGEQQRLLDAACCGDRALAAQVNALLEADADGHPILHEEAGVLARHLLDGASGPVLSGRMGRYVIQRYLGEGGMGSVYLAKRDDLGDCVALKFLHGVWSSPVGRRRFAREQMTLASLNHRHIARLYDAGVTNGTPWFAMEYVEGLSIVEHCERHRLELRERLQLFRAACEAVSYAHRNLTVHLDVKPSNVLVNGNGEIKLLDFGVARHLARDGGAADTTTTVHRFLSLNFASPEQIRGEPLDVQADVYGLGVLLYQLLSGAPPVNLTGLNAAELANVLDDEPRPPSLATRDAGPGAVEASRTQWKDLDVLCLKAIRRSKSERYQTVDRLLSDVDHFLRDEPIDAQTDNFHYYRLRKFMRRHRRSVATAAAVVVAMAAVILFFNLRLIVARDQALSSEARMERVYRLMLNLFDGDDSAAAPAEWLRVATLLDRGVRGAQTLQGDPDLQAELNYTFGGLFHRLGHISRAEPLLISALTTRRLIFGADHPQTIRPQLALALLRLDQSRTQEAEDLVRASLEVARRRYAAESVEVARCVAMLGKVLVTQGKYDAAAPLLDQAVTVLSKGRPSLDLSEALADLANVQYYLGHVDPAEAINQQALSVDYALFGERHPAVAIDLFNLGNIQLDRGNYIEGERLFSQALQIHEDWYGTSHPRTASHLLMLGRSIAYQGRLSEAAALYDRALVAMRALYGEHHARFAAVLSLMGDLARERRAFDDAERLFERAAAVFKEVSGEEHEFHLHQLSNVGSVYLARGKYAEAVETLRNAARRLTAVVPNQRYTGLAEIRLGAALAGQKQYQEAERHARAGYEILRKVTSPASVEMREARKALADIYTALNEPSQAKALQDNPARREDVRSTPIAGAMRKSAR